MCDYESAWGQYKGWDRTRRIELLSSLIDTFEESAAPPSTGPVGFWSALPLKEYERCVRGRPLKWEDHPSFVCFVHCVNRMLPFTRGTPEEVKIDFVFDCNPKLGRANPRDLFAVALSPRLRGIPPPLRVMFGLRRAATRRRFRPQTFSRVRMLQSMSSTLCQLSRPKAKISGADRVENRALRTTPC